MKTVDAQEIVVNQVADLKGPLKGKGGSLAQWKDEVLDKLERLHAEMAMLSNESGSIQGRSFSLKVYSLRSSRQLRWRMTSSKHATWSRIELLLPNLSPGLVDWYQAAQVVAQILNHREQVLRYELKTVERLMATGPRVARQYRSSVGRGVGGGRPGLSAGTSTALP